MWHFEMLADGATACPEMHPVLIQRLASLRASTRLRRKISGRISVPSIVTIQTVSEPKTHAVVPLMVRPSPTRVATNSAATVETSPTRARERVRVLAGHDQEPRREDALQDGEHHDGDEEPGRRRR